MGQSVRAEFAQWLREQLRSQGWMVSDFAEKVGVRPSAVYRWTAGQRTPTDAQIDRIAAALNMSSEAIWETLARYGVTPIGGGGSSSTPRPTPPRAASPAGPAPERPFAQWLRARLAERGWSTGFLARKMDLDPVTVRAWVTGAREPASVQIPRIAAAFEVDPETVRQLLQPPESPAAGP